LYNRKYGTFTYQVNLRAVVRVEVVVGIIVRTQPRSVGNIVRPVRDFRLFAIGSVLKPMLKNFFIYVTAAARLFTIDNFSLAGDRFASKAWNPKLVRRIIMCLGRV
jgi:hypothetical protein